MFDLLWLAALTALCAALLSPLRKRGRGWVIVWLLSALLGAVVPSSLLSRSRGVQLFGRLVSHVQTHERVIALTFDDGPFADTTPGVLAQLREHQAKATFFVVGNEAAAAPAALRAIVADGHELGNHSWSHRRLLVVSQSTLAQELGRTDEVIRAARHAGPILFRPPHGKRLLDAPLYLARHERTTVMWDLELDTQNAATGDAAAMTRHALAHAHPGAILLMHVLHPGRAVERAALPAVLDGLKRAGYRFVSVSELLGLEAG